MEMEVVSGIGEDAKPKACSSQIGSATQQLDSGEKTLGEENGVRVSVNGEPKVLSDFNGDNNESKETENLNGSGVVVVGTKNLNGSGVVVEDCVVMNGVSSLLKLKEDLSDKDDEDEDGEEEEDDEEEEEEEEEHRYYVGDFVWGKIKNHPWWPGQIYDPSEASELALKVKQKGKLLVAYFGDGTFAWCSPSQLKPFADNFKECSKVSNSRSFIVAVEEAVKEIGRHIERLLICDCVEETHKFDNTEAKNAGIKEGVVVHGVRRDMISSLLLGYPGDIVEDVKGFAETVSFSGLLELEILKRKVSAFYRSKRGYGLSEYHEPRSVPGLEDKNNDDEDEKIEEEEEVLDPETSVQKSLGKCSGFSDPRLHHRRKQKSIAEILENESAAKVRFETEPADGNVKSGGKKVKRGDESSEVENVRTTTPKSRSVNEISAIEGAGNKKTLSRKKKTTKNNNVDDKEDDESGHREVSVNVEETEKNEVSDADTDIDSTPLASLRKRVRVDASSAEKTTGNGDRGTLSSKRERKKSKYYSPEFLSDFSWKGKKKSKNESESSKVSSQDQAGEQMTDASDSLVEEKEDTLDGPLEPALDNSLNHQELSQELSNAVDFLRLGATPKEMQDLIRVAALGTKYPKDSSSRDMVREFMSIYRSFTYNDGANSKFLGSYTSFDNEKEELNETGKTETKGEERKEKKLKAKQQTEETETKGDERKEKKLKAKQQTEETEQIGKEENETEKLGTTKKERKPKKPKSKKQGDGEKEETLKESIESAKKERKRKKPESKKQAEEEPLKQLSETTKKERMRKKPDSKKQADDEGEETLKESNETTKKERKRKKPDSKKRAGEEEETLKESSETTKKEKKRESKKQADDNEEETRKELSEATKKERKREKPQNEEEETLTETEKSEKKKKREGKSKRQKVDDETIETEKAISGAELLVTFGPGSSLPKKEDLIEIYEKFGALDEERTYMYVNNFCARVVFLNITDGEKAYESSQEKCPFASTNGVKFRLKYPNEGTVKKKAEAEVAETTTETEYVKKKLEEMRVLVDESEGGMSEEVKVKLEDEMVNLLEKVRKIKST